MSQRHASFLPLPASEAIFRAVISRLLFHDTLTGQMLPGIALILAGILPELLRRPDGAQTQIITDGAEAPKEDISC